MSKSLTDKHLVLDLDSTVIHSSQDLDELKSLKIYSKPKNAHLRDRIYSFEMVDVISTEGTGDSMRMWGVYRPHLKEFMEFAATYFEEVHIWSAGQHIYVYSIAECISGKTGINFDHILTNEHCDFEEKTNKKGQTYSYVYKPLKKFYKSYGGNANETNTLIIDDRDDTFSKNSGNGILISRYEPDASPKEIMQEDISLLQLKQWLMKEDVLKCKDVRTLDKRGIFKEKLT